MTGTVSVILYLLCSYVSRWCVLMLYWLIMTFPLQVVFELKKKEIEKARSQLEEGRERGEFKASANHHYQHIGLSLGEIATDTCNQTQASVPDDSTGFRY